MAAATAENRDGAIPIRAGVRNARRVRREYAVEPPVQSHQTRGVEADETRPFGLDRRPDRLQAHEQPLPRVGDPDRVRWHEHQPRTACQRLPQLHPGVDAERLSRERHLSHLLHSAGLWSQRRGRLQEFGTIAGGDGQLEPREENTDDLRHHEHMFAWAPDGTHPVTSSHACYGAPYGASQSR